MLVDEKMAFLNLHLKKGTKNLFKYFVL